MALTQRLQIRQSQALVMTPQLMQAIKLLELSNLDLAAYVARELERNPLLEPAGDGDAEGAGAPAPAANALADEVGSAWQKPAGVADPAARRADALDDVQPADADAATSRSNGADAAACFERGGAQGRHAGDDYNPEAFVAAEVTLADHLAEQLALAVTDPARRMIGQYLIDLVDEAGYLCSDLDPVAEKLGTSRGEVETVLSTLQGFDPPGVCARNLAECLAIQLK